MALSINRMHIINITGLSTFVEMPPTP